MKSDQVTIRHRNDLMGEIDENEGYIRNKWSEQEMIQTRRSVSSSPSSESESNDIPDADKHQPKMPSHPTNAPNTTATSNQIGISNTLRVNEMALNENIQEMVPFAIQQQAMQHTAGQLNQFNFPNENGPVSLFPPSSTTSHNTQIPFPSPGAAMFPPSFVNAYASATLATSQQQTVTKPADGLPVNSMNNQLNYPSNICAAAFTALSRNIALTTSMMAPSPVQSDAPPITPPNTHLTSVPSHVTGNNNNNNINTTKMDFNRRKYKTGFFFHQNIKLILNLNI